MNLTATKSPTASAQNGAKTSLTPPRANYKNAVSIANADGKTMGKVNVAFDLEFIQPLKGSVIFIDSSGAPTEKGWYRVDRKSHALAQISDNDISDLEWHERIYVHPAALQAAEEKRPLMFYIGFGERLILDGNYNPDLTLPVAQVEMGHETAAPQTAGVLRA
jgi:hypothetical protein